MQPKRSPLLLATAALGVLAIGGLAINFLLPHGGPAAPPVGGKALAAQATPTPVPSMQWVAAMDIPPRTRLKPEMFRRAAYTGKPGELKGGGITNISDVQDELTNETIPRGHPITLASFSTGLKRVLPANMEVPSGFRAVAIFVDPVSTAASLVDVGDRVDVIAVHKLTVDKDKNQIVVGALQFSTGRLIATNLQVLAVEKSLGAPPPVPTPVPQSAAAGVENGPAAPPTPTPPPPPAGAAPSKIRVILAAPVDIATRLVAANDQGTLHITIRNPVDGDNTASPEAHEYPSRIVSQKEINTSAHSTGKALGQGMMEGIGKVGRRPREPLSSPDFNPFGPTPATQAPASVPTPVATLPTPPLPPTSDITVIRGTEKTRVLVPQR